MNNFNRREFLKLMGITTAAVATPSLLKAATGNMPARVVVVGSGFAGSTVAKHLRLWSDNTIDVTVVDPNPAHVSCVMSNLVVNGQLTMSDITFEHVLLQELYGINFIQGVVTGVISGVGGKTVQLANGNNLQCDYVVLAPGINMDNISGLDHAKVPHAWIAGPQTALLRDQLAAMPAGGTFVMTVPKVPYRCPPGPYERACIVADLVKQKGGGSVVVLDMNDKIVVEEHMFSTAFNETYNGIVDYRSGVTIQAVNSDELSIQTSEGLFNADVLNVIPPHRAGKIISDLGFNTLNNRWADVNPISYELNQEPGIFVIGDSGGTNQPKSGHMANSQAKVCAAAIIDLLADRAPEQEPVINNTCYSFVDQQQAMHVAAVHRYDKNTKLMKAMPGGGLSEHESIKEGEYAKAWAENIWQDSLR